MGADHPPTPGAGPLPTEVPAELVYAVTKSAWDDVPECLCGPMGCICGAYSRHVIQVLVSHPAFAPWFLRVLAQREPLIRQIAYALMAESQQMAGEQEDAFGPVEVPPITDAGPYYRLADAALNALAPGGPKEGT